MKIVRSRLRNIWRLLLCLCGVAVLWLSAPTAGHSQIRPKGSISPHAPTWYNAPPVRNDTLIARGKGTSDDQQTAIDEGVAEARSILAMMVDRQWKELLRNIEDETGARSPSLPEPVILEGSRVVMSTVEQQKGAWTAYVLVGVPALSARTFLLRRLHTDAAWYEKVRSSESVRSFERPAR